MKLSEVRELLDELRQVLHAWLDALHAELTTRDAAEQIGARPAPVTTSRAVSSVANVVVGYALRDSGGAGATVRIHDGSDATGDTLLPIQLAANASENVWFGGRGPSFANGVFVEVASGAVEGAVFLRR